MPQTQTIEIPDNNTLTQKVADFIKNGGDIQNLDVPSMLNITAQELTTAQRAENFRAPAMNAEWERSRRALGRTPNRADHRIWSDGAARTLRNAFKDWAEQKRLWATFEKNAASGMAIMTKKAPNEFLQVQFPTQEIIDNLVRREVIEEHAGSVWENVFVYSHAYREHVIAQNAWRAVEVDGQTLGAVRDDNKTLLVFVNLFGDEAKNDWANPTAAIARGHVQLLDKIYEAAKQYLGDVTVQGENLDQARVDLLRAGAAHLDTLKAMIIAELGNIDREGATLKNRMQELTRQSASYQQNLATYIQRINQYDHILTQLPDTTQFDLAPLQAMLTARNRITDMPHVEKVEFKPHASPALDITTKPCHVQMDDHLRVVPALTFRLSVDQHYGPRVTLVEGEHPLATREMIDFGNTAIPVSEALGRADWVQIAQLLGRLVQQYSPGNTLVRPSRFTVAPAGATAGFVL